jgi:hypothetical protein
MAIKTIKITEKVIFLATAVKQANWICGELIAGDSIHVTIK